MVTAAPYPEVMGPTRSAGTTFRTVLVTVGVVVVVLLLLGLSPWRIDLPSPFETDEKERPQSALLTDLRDVSRYEAATGSFQVVIDSEQDARYLPDFIKGERVIFIAEGSVDAAVDFSSLTKGAIKVSEDGDTVTITLPPPELTKPRIDPDRTRVQSRDRGVLDRIEDALGNQPTDDQPLYQRANDKIAAAARRSELLARARKNTEAMLRALLKDLGYEKVIVRFEKPDGP